MKQLAAQTPQSPIMQRVVTAQAQIEAINTIAAAIADRSASDALRVMLAANISRDPVDAANDFAFAADLFSNLAAACAARRA